MDPKSMNLQRFIDAKQAELASLRQYMPAASHAPRPDFYQTLMAPPRGALHLIAEYKQASPSEGIINKTRPVAKAAQAYQQGGASCMSVLTEEQYFLGHCEHLNQAAKTCTMPLLRKDFLFDPLQIEQTFATPASALLLIVALTPSVAQLRELREMAESQGIHAIVEIFSQAELEIARESGAKIIQVNARNLETFKTDRAESLRLGQQRAPHECWIAASAMSEAAHLVAAQQAGYQAALIGTTLMRSENPSQSITTLLQ